MQGKLFFLGIESPRQVVAEIRQVSFGSLHSFVHPSDLPSTNQALGLDAGHGAHSLPGNTGELHGDKAREALPFKTKQVGSFLLRFGGVDSSAAADSP